MRNRTSVGQYLGLALVLGAVVGFSAIFQRPTPSADGSTLGPVGSSPAGVAAGSLDCTDSVTPDKVGQAGFERYGLAEMLQDGQFVRQESGGHVDCSFSGPAYRFDGLTGELLLTQLMWDDALRELEASRQPTPQPTIPAPTGDVITVCFDGETPVIELGDENPERLGIWDILGGAGCAVEISNQICWDCGDDRGWRPAPPMADGGQAPPVPFERDGDDMVCIDALAVVEADGAEVEGIDAGKLANTTCSLSLGFPICWECYEGAPEPLPSTMPTSEVAEVAPTEEIGGPPSCRDYVTPESVGAQEFERYGLAQKLQDDSFQRKLTETPPGQIICYGGRVQDGVTVYKDELYFRFDLETGALLMERIHWREDLPQQLPPPLISQQEAEAMADGEVVRSYLTLVSPGDFSFFDKDWNPRQDPVPESTYEHPWWLVSWRRSGDCCARWFTAIDAITGELIGQFMP